jgi:hypothetical protein
MSNAKQCARCGAIAENFISIEPGMRVALQEAGEASLPESVCPSCYEQLASGVSQGLKLRMERDVREKNKMVMWKNRVHLIKNARNLMNQKAYSEAAVQYEKYLRVLEMVYSLKKGELSPAVFNNSTRSKELTVIASVYWDLMRIYDTSPRYGERMVQAGAKLSQFLPFSQIYPDILKKAESFSRSCKNPQIMRDFLRSTKSRRGPCFVATAAFADEPNAVELWILRRYRDEVLRPSPAGRRLIALYYRYSPPLARAIGRSSKRTVATRWILTKVASHLKKNLNSLSRIGDLDR